MSAPPDLPGRRASRLRRSPARPATSPSAATRPAGCWPRWPPPAAARWPSSAPAAASARPGCAPGSATDARILTAELDPKLAEAAAEIFDDDPQVEVLAADWSTLRRQGAVLAALPGLGQAEGRRPRQVCGPRRGGRHRRARRLHAVRALAADLRRPRRHAARGVAQRRAVHHRRGDDRRGRCLRASIADQALVPDAAPCPPPRGARPPRASPRSAPWAADRDRPVVDGDAEDDRHQHVPAERQHRVGQRPERADVDDDPHADQIGRQPGCRAPVAASACAR